MQRDGIVMDLQNEYAVVMTKDGQFCKLPRSAGMDVGVEVSWESMGAGAYRSTSGTGSFRRRSVRAWNRLGMAGAAACLLVAAGVWFVNQSLHPTQAEAYAFVSLDINPSVSLQVDQHQKVLNAYGNNSDGSELLQHLHVRQESLQQAVKDIVDAAVANNMLPSNDTILVTAAPSDNNVNIAQVQQQAAQSVEAAVQSNVAAVQKHPRVYTLGLSNAVWTAADHASLSPGKFAAYLMAQKEGYNVSLNQLTGPALGNILSSPDAEQVAKTLSDKNVQQLEKLIQQVGGDKSGTAHADGSKGTNSTNTGNGQAGKNNTTGQGSDSHNGSSQSGKDHPGKGHGESGKEGNKGGNNGADIQVQVGNTVITIPVQPLIPLPGPVGESDKHGNGHDNGIGLLSHGDHGSDKHDDRSGDGKNGDSWPEQQGHQEGHGHE